eukprot:2362677-Alexandrium_andersonii.AAC.1
MIRLRRRTSLKSPESPPQSPFHLAEEGFGHHLLRPIQVRVVAGEGEIAPQDNAPEVAVGV